ncbi:MAG: CDP-diacylglycerol--serine O-phosphatidyltransferase [Gammaproteobacteria bacterium]
MPQDNPVHVKPSLRDPPRRGIYILPNLFTTGALFAGFYAIVAAMSDRFAAASAAIFIAMVMDGLDGRVARLTHTESDFGKEFDSLSDMVSFGLAPALIVYQWGFQGMSEYGWLWAKLGWLGAFFYAIATALRLARFNTRVGKVDKRLFQGLPSPAAAGLVAGFIWLGVDLEFTGRDMAIPTFALTVAAGALMVSNISYYSFKDLNLGQRVEFRYLLVLPLMLILIAASPPKMLFSIFFVYAMSGPTLSVLRWRKRRMRHLRRGTSNDEVGK